ncbi:MAG: exosortase-associated EpsI family protein [Phycisphaerales bacterium]|nr:exosortase-associated EpsI family protein [Phycisphaerales bacterium]MCI0631184.1 exosortase-associated EpsI family protein [Phycisphaerales bacterium]
MQYFDKHAKPALVVACGLLLVCGLGFRWAVSQLNVYLKKEPVELRGSFDTISRSIGRWRALGKDHLLDEAMLMELGTTKYLDRVYAIDGDARQGVLNAHVAYYTGLIDAVPHVPDRCLVAAGFHKKTQPENLPLEVDRSSWVEDSEFTNLATGQAYWNVRFKHDFTGQVVDVRMPVGDLRLRTTEFERPSQRNARVFGGYFFIANGRATATPEGVRVMAFSLSEKYAYYCKVQFIYSAADATPGKFVELVSEFLKDFLPELMQRLPDWAEVERRNEQRVAAASN